ncbi:flagellar M-ring protein FliF [Rhodobacteraceae bacterium RKSG542]|uniref:flagellar basal-body MS-ring/collar protein FliF n=1 Tax=Pseudovibrio flavus TaxID=2529854 RepID=UPI0012BCAA7E|nr:flagellar M-ring protein FliF [Pseudovibrio flavus]
MAARENAEKIYSNLAQLGTQRLIALAFVGVLTFVAIGVAAYLLSRPDQEVLYANLARDDVSQIGMALQTAGIPFDVSADGTVVTVSMGTTARARMLLAEKGLPRGSGAGYELFDQMGSLGLTSFMQGVTRIRALEGEVARTIQSMRGVKAARVHLVLPEKASFRRDTQKPSASVVIRTEGAASNAMAQSIRHLVSAAVPGLAADAVTVLDTDGTLLAAGEDAQSASTGRKATIEDTVAHRVESNVRRALAPYLGIGNFEVSVAAAINTDTQKVSETTFDPDSRVERSFRVVRENNKAQNSSLETPTTVEQNLPEEDVSAQGGERSSEEADRREELTNYEISSRTVETYFDDYRVERLTIAVVVNQERIGEALARAGGEASPEAVEAKLSEIQQIISAAAGTNADRGDTINVSAVNFLTSEEQLAAIPESTLMDALMRNMGSVVNALAILVVTLMIIWFGLRPAVAFLLPVQQEVVAEGPNVGADGSMGTIHENVGFDDVDAIERLIINEEEGSTVVNRVSLKKLERAVELDDVQAAIILKQWMYNGEMA